MSVWLHKIAATGKWVAVDLQTGSIVAGPGYRGDVIDICELNGWTIAGSD